MCTTATAKRRRKIARQDKRSKRFWRRRMLPTRGSTKK